jgi:hypothetical protein
VCFKLTYESQSQVEYTTTNSKLVFKAKRRPMAPRVGVASYQSIEHFSHSNVTRSQQQWPVTGLASNSPSTWVTKTMLMELNRDIKTFGWTAD